MNDRTRFTPEDDAPLVPELPRDAALRADGGTLEVSGVADPPIDTSYAEERTQDTEEVVPMVPDLTRRTTD